MRLFMHIMEQRHVLRRRQLRGEVQGMLLVTARMLLSPEDSQELRPVILHVERAGHFRMARQAERQHLRGVTVPRFPMMHGH